MLSLICPELGVTPQVDTGTDLEDELSIPASPPADVNNEVVALSIGAEPQGFPPLKHGEMSLAVNFIGDRRCIRCWDINRVVMYNDLCGISRCMWQKKGLVNR